MRLSLVVLLSLAGHAFARTEAAPPPKVHVVTGKVRSLETLAIARPYQLLIIDITGPATVKLERAEIIPWDPKTSCKVAWALHGGADLVAKKGDVVGPFATTVCAAGDMFPDGVPPWARIISSIVPVTVGPGTLDAYVPTTFERVKEGDAVALKSLRRLVEVFGTDYQGPFGLSVGNALVDIRTLEALRFGVDKELSGVWDSVMWRYVPGAYEAIEPFVIADITSGKVRRLDLIEALWQLSPKRTRALIARLLPKHAKSVALYSSQLADPGVYDLLIAHHRTTTVAAEKKAIEDRLADTYAKLPADAYLEPFFTQAGSTAALATISERRKLGLHAPATLRAFVEKHNYDYGRFKLLKGTRISWKVQLDHSFGVEPTNNIKVSFREDAEVAKPQQGSWVMLEGVVRTATTSTSTYNLHVEIDYARFAPAP